MDGESLTFGVATAVLVAGLVVLLFGVSLNNAEELNAPIVAGSAVFLVGIGVLAAGVISLEEVHAPE